MAGTISMASVLLHHDSDTIRLYRADGDTFADLGQIRFDRAFASAALLGSTLVCVYGI